MSREEELGLRESVERGLLAPGSSTLEQSQHGVISPSAVPAEAGLWMGVCVLEPLSEWVPSGLTVPGECRHASVWFGVQAVELRLQRQDPVLSGSLQ